jgi:hypothetical protein
MFAGRRSLGDAAELIPAWSVLESKGGSLFASAEAQDPIAPAIPGIIACLFRRSIRLRHREVTEMEIIKRLIYILAGIVLGWAGFRSCANLQYSSKPSILSPAHSSSAGPDEGGPPKKQ